jgi:hypothetical protein
MIYSFAIIAFAALIHASFQLSVSVLTLLSGHAIGAKTAHTKLVRLVGSFLTGAAVMTLLLLSFFILFFQGSPAGITPLTWSVACGLLIGLGIAVWAFYYRREEGTSLWLPRGMARFLTERTKATKQASEAFSLGLASIIAELLFIIAPLLVAALVICTLPYDWRPAGIILYLAVSLISLIIVTVLIGGGHKLSRIQRWREDNKRFLQFAAGSGLLVLGIYLYVDRVVAVAALHTGGF